MKKTIILITLIAISTFSMAQSNITEQQYQNFKNEITNAGYFNYVINKEEIKIWEKLQKVGLLEYGWLRFPDHSWIVQEQTGQYPQNDDKLFDYRTIIVDGDYMFRGGMED